jgi:hypothetical protein
LAGAARSAPRLKGSHRRQGASNRLATSAAAGTPALAYAFYSRGEESWKKLCTEFDRSLDARFDRYQSFTHRDRFDFGAADIVIGQSEHCLEVLLKAVASTARPHDRAPGVHRPR